MESSYPSEDAPVFVISIAAELAGMHPQTLRQYDRLGLVSPGRAPGGGRRYSARDLAMLREVARLSAEGVNLAGIKRIVELEAVVGSLTAEIDRLRGEVAALVEDASRQQPSYLPAVRWPDPFGWAAPTRTARHRLPEAP